MKKLIKRKYISVVQKHLGEILKFPEIVGDVEDSLEKRKVKKTCDWIEGKLRFYIQDDEIESEQFLKDLWVYVEVELTRHNPSTLVFEAWNKKDSFEFELNNFTDCFHMGNRKNPSCSCFSDLIVQWRKRIMELLV